MSTTRTRIPGWSASLTGAALLPALALVVALPLFASFVPLLRGAGPVANLGRALGEARFVRSFGYGLAQAGASALLALAVGLPGAYLVAKKRFPFKRALSALSAVPFCVPPLIVALGFVLYYGREGLLNRLLMGVFGLEAPPLDFLYSFFGVVVAHGFYNFPLVMRMVGDAWASAPRAQEDAARLLGASEPRVFFTVTLPSLLPAIGAALSLVFIMCFYSFVLILLFGGPGAGTPEVELYRAARFEFDRELAAAFALVETLVALGFLYCYARIEASARGTREEHAPRNPPERFRTRLGVAAALGYGLFVTVFFLGPLVAIVAESFMVQGRMASAALPGFGNYAKLFGSASFGKAVLNTLLLGLASAALAAGLGFAFSLALKKSRSALAASVLPMLPLAISGVALAYGWTLVLGEASPFTVAMVQAVSAYPFILKSIQSTLGRGDERLGEAALTLGSSRMGAILRVRLPLAAPALLSGFAFAFAISAGDANALIVAPVSGFDTLALNLYRLAGSYRFNEACAAAVLLGVASALVFSLKDTRDAAA